MLIEFMSFTIFESIFVYLGFFLVLSTLLNELWKNILRPGYNLSKRYGSKTWVLITGATDGIGKAFAFSLAQRNFNIVLISRNQSKLNECADQIQKKYHGIQVETICKDFTLTYTENFFDDIQNKLNSKDISILVNNVGLAEYCEFDKLSDKCIKNTLVVNTLPQALMTRIILPKMLIRQKRSAIIDLSSYISNTTITCFLGLYGATKTFSSFLTHALSIELKSKNIDCMSLKPLHVCSSMTLYEKEFGSITPEKCAEGALRHLGYQNESYGYWSHCLQGWFFSFLPFELIGSLYRESIRKLAIVFSKKKGYFQEYYNFY